ncbi:hypothetical protein INT45_001007 [Circinella minor]|uniref:Uncharacterized protein n=1 Tax=Circinella minor TaxID=1195481 RepID=A0A8H7SBV9_9FUNG|nr:hypothetical protein INT45_001007 [Circinella minor]
MGQHQSKTGRHRRGSNNNRARHFPSTSSSTSLAPNSSPQPPQPQPLRTQQLQRQRQQQFQHNRSSSHYHNSSPTLQQSSSSSSILKQQQQRLSNSPYSSHQPSTISISQPILIDDDDEGSYGPRLSIDFYSNDTTSLIKNHIMKESPLTINDDRLLYSDLQEYIPPTLSSSSSLSSTASLETAMFSTISSPSSMSSAAPSIYSSKFTPVQQQPALIHVRQQQQQHRRSNIVTNVTQTTNKKSTGAPSLTAPSSTSSLLLPSSSGTSTTAATDNSSSLVTTANDQSTFVSQASKNEQQQQQYQDLYRLVKSKQIEAYYPFGIFQYYGMTSSGKPSYDKAFTLFQGAAVEYIKLLDAQPNHPQYEQIRGIVSSSQYYLGEMLLNGKKGTLKDEMKALKYFTSAANHSYPPAQYMIGYYYQHGKADYKINLQVAYEWYSAAAAQGYSKAQAAVSKLLLKQIDGNNKVVFDNRSKNELLQKTLILLESAAEKGNADGLLQLAFLYEEGIHVEKSLCRAFDFYERLLDNVDDGNYGATHYMMGVNYRHGSNDLTRDDELALKHFQLSAQSGYPQGQRVLGNMYADGIGVTKNESEAHQLFKKAAAQGDPLASCLLAKQYEYGRGCSKNIQEAINHYEQAAQRTETLPVNCVPAQLALAMLLDTSGRHEEAFEWFQKVATSKNFKEGTTSKELESMYMHKLALYRNTARLYIALYQLHGNGLLQTDPIAAFKLLLNLADTEDFADAHYHTACAYKDGIAGVVERNPKLAYDYFRKAADLGHMFSQFNAADMLSNGFAFTDEQGVQHLVKDREQAYYLYASASTQGHSLSQMCEAVYYIEGLPPVDRDLERAEELLRGAVIRGLPEAMVTLSRILINNPDTVAEAYTWLLKAAKRDNIDAMRELAKAYEMNLLPVAEGKTNYQEGYAWLEKAALFNDPRAWFQMAQYHEKGWFVECCIENQYECLKKSEDLGYVRASFAIAKLFESQSERDQAFWQYTTIIENYNLTSQYGWHARLHSCRLVVLHNLRERNEQIDVYTMLQEMVEHGSKENIIEPLELLGICCEIGIGTAHDILRAIEWYRRAVNVQSSVTIDWAQDRARSRLAKLLIDKDEHTEAFHHLQQLGPRLDQMKGNQESSETVMQAREARYYFGYLLLYGNGIEGDSTEAKKWLTVAADQGHGDAAYELGLLAVQEQKYDEARRRFNQGATSGHPGSMRELAMVNYREQQTETFDDADDASQYDTSQTKYLLEDAESAGDVEALTQLGLLYETGFGSAFPKDLGIALKYYSKALNLGHQMAAIYKAEIFNSLDRYIDAMVWFNRFPSHWIARFRMATYRILNVAETGQNPQENFNDLRTAVESTLAPTLEHDRKIWCSACVFLGSCYQRGQGMDQDFNKAIHWYTLGADIQQIRNTDAMLHLGGLYNELGRDEDALQWFHEAATRRNMKAQFQMGLFHKNGFATLEPNPVAAARYFTAAKNQGHIEAIYELASIYWEQYNYEEGWRLHLSAADEHYIPAALRSVGYIYDQGFSGIDRNKNKRFVIVQDRKKAFSYFCQAAELNDNLSIAMVGSYYQDGYEPYEGNNMEIALDCYQRAYQDPENTSNRPILQLVIGRLMHIMANRFHDREEQAQLLHRQAYAWFEKAVHEARGVQTNPAQMMVALYHLHGWYSLEHRPELGFQELLELEQANDNQVYKLIAQHIAQCYEEAIGVHQDYSQALIRWMKLARLGDDQALQKIYEYSKRNLATDEQLQKAKSLFKEATRSEANTASSGSSYA